MEPLKTTKPQPGVVRIASAFHNEGRGGFLESAARIVGRAAEIETRLLPRLGGFTGPGGPEEQARAREEVAQYIRVNRPGIMILEWNLGRGNQSEPTFPPEFFEQFPDTRFILGTGTIVPKGTLAPYKELSNVTTDLINNEDEAKLKTKITVKEVMERVVPQAAMAARKTLPLSGDVVNVEDDHGQASRLPSVNSDLLNATNDAREAAGESLEHARANPFPTPPTAGEGGDGPGHESHESEEGHGFEGGEGRR